MKKIFFLAFAIIMCSRIFAAPIDTLTAKNIGQNFLNERFHFKKNSSQQNVVLELLSKQSTKNKLDLYYVFKINETEGFIIISANDKIFPVLGYSFESSFSQISQNQPEAFLEWLKNTENQMEYILEKNLKPDSKTIEAWTYYQTNPTKNKNSLKNVSPILSTNWNQGKYYNTLCPIGSGGDNGHVWVGCVAVCMAQVMKYWNYPDYGSGQNSYVCSPYGTQTADFAATYYNWAAMPNSLSAENTAVATLLYHCGVAVNMHYAPGGSASDMYSAMQALKLKFDYSAQIQLLHKWTYTDFAWDSVLRAEMDLGQPVSYAGGNHAFNIDGYQGTNYFHVNWGWGGSYNGYFYFSALNPGTSNFTSSQMAIVNIRPNCGQASIELSALLDYSGTITDNGGATSNYANCSDSKTLISPPGATKIKLFITDFKTVSGQDTLYVYDGANDNSALVYALSGSIDPFEFLSSTGKLYLRFKSGNFTTEKGYSINYISAFDDTGVTGLLSPSGKTCGIANDSIIVVVKNFGINTKTNIPITVKISTPSGIETYNKTLAGPLATNQSDTIYINTVNTYYPGNYSFACYTQTVGDMMINSNDTVNKTVSIKEIQQCPFFENVDDLNNNMQDWIDLNRKTWINMENKGSNYFFRAYVGGGETGGGSQGEENKEQFFIYDRKIAITDSSSLYLDYRILTWSQTPIPAVLTNNEKIKILVSSDCGNDFDTIFTIDASSHVTDSSFKQLKIPLTAYAGQNVIVGFTTSWDAVMSSIDYDNIVVVDSSAAITPTSISQLPNNAKLSIYPNPTKGKFTIQNINTTQNMVNVIIMDITGKLVLNEQLILNNKQLTIDLANKPAGIYFIGINSANKTIFGKISKE